HIRMLERAQLVRRRLAGREHYLSLNAQALDAAALWLATQRSAWAAQLSDLDALLRAEDTIAATRRRPGNRGKP
ncbi:MAG TPA: hypothetical protein VES36_06615, partial [Candidatus Limnocylindrales bacterium]|nr:hypothetical protein [Candidatus Limnocylindrales bacterium]